MEEWKTNSKIYFQYSIIPATFAPGFLWSYIKATFFEGYFYYSIDTFTWKSVQNGKIIGSLFESPLKRLKFGLEISRLGSSWTN
jgi:hypothetical protein